MGKITIMFCSQRNWTGSLLFIVLYLLMEINTHSMIDAASMETAEGSCSSSQTCEGPTCSDTSETCKGVPSRPSLEDDKCAFDAESGLCISNPEEIFENCSPDDYCLHREDFGAYVVVSPIYLSGIPGSCANDPAEYCEDFAIDEHACLLNPGFMSELCPKSCFICFENDNDNGSNTSLVRVQIGLKQTMPLKTTEKMKKRFYEVIAETTSYMAKEIFVKKEFEAVRRDCRNNDDRCAFMVATTDGAFCDEPDSEKICGPACKACGEMMLTEDELEILDPCLPDYSMDIFKNGKPEINSKTADEYEKDDHNNSQTLDAMFRRIIGELPYPSAPGETYPIVPGVNYTVKVLSRPSFDPDVNTKMSRDWIDFHTGGPWIVVLDDFLSPEECDRLITLGDLLGREKSTIHDDEDEEEMETSVTVGTDGVGEAEPEWRTSSTAWCDESCKTDPIASRVQKRIELTTGVKYEYFEDLQLLKYSK